MRATLTFNGLTPINVFLNVCVELRSFNVHIKHKLWIIDSTQNLPKSFGILVLFNCVNGNDFT